MVAWAVTNMGGEIPMTDPRLLQSGSADTALDCDLVAGSLAGLPIPVPVQSFNVGNPQRAYRFPASSPGVADAWQPLPSPYSSVVRSPLANDSLQRIYWTNPNDGAYWSTFAMVAGGLLPYNLGFIAPNTDPTSVGGVVVAAPQVVAAGGTPESQVPYEARSYLYTFVDQYGAESSPSLPSATVLGAVDGTWTLENFPFQQPTAPGKNYPAVTIIRLYRTVTGSTTGGQFFQVTDFDATAFTRGGTINGYQDTSTDASIINNNPLPSATWQPPPAGLDGLTSLPGGMLVGFTGNTVHFCEPDYPHAWPATYDLSVDYPIVGFGVWQQNLMILTTGYPSSGSGNSPANFTLSQIQVPEPCISRGSIVTDLMGVYYASQNGLIQLSYFGMTNQSQSFIDRLQWISDFGAKSLIACRHRTQYLAINGLGEGFIIDYLNPRLGVVRLSTLGLIQCVWNDIYTGDTYMMSNGTVYLWDSASSTQTVFYWRSKLFELPSPVSLAAAQIFCSPLVADPPAVVANPLSANPPQLQLSAAVQCLFRLWVGGVANGHKVLELAITEPLQIFRLPSGFRAFQYQFEIISRVPVYKVELANSMRELKTV